jgi:hypothetical protein
VTAIDRNATIDRLENLLEADWECRRGIFCSWERKAVIDAIALLRTPAPAPVVECTRNCDCVGECKAGIESAPTPAGGVTEDDPDIAPGKYPEGSWAYVHEGTICIDWDRDPKRQMSIMVLKDGAVCWAIYLNGERLNGPDADTPEFIAAVHRWSDPRTVYDNTPNPSAALVRGEVGNG